MPITKCSEIITNTQVDEEADEEGDEEALPLVSSSFADSSDQHFLLQ